jgi:uncharacterized protein YhbP (UPF0306 family)
MAIEQSTRRISASRMKSMMRRLLEASTLCSIATLSPGERPCVNTAYFARSPDVGLVWLSDPEARHSRNLESSASTAIAVYDANQVWGRPDRGIQLFGTARPVGARAARECAALYGRRFPGYAQTEPTDYHLYRFTPRRVKIFDEPALGAGVFVTATVSRNGLLTWERTETSRAGP